MSNEVPQKYIRTKSDEVAIEEGMWWDESYAEHVRQFAKKFCRASQGKLANRPVDFLDWQYEEIIRPIYSWRKLTKFGGKNIKRHGRGSIWLPKKNGKSFIISILALYEFVATGEPGASVGCFAGDKKQAGIIFDETMKFVNASPQLMRRLKPLKSKGQIFDAKTNSKIEVYSAIADTKQGFNLSAVFADEMATFDRELWEAIIFSTIARDEGFICSISMAGEDRLGIGFQEFQYAKRLLDKHNPIIDTSVYPLIYELPENEAHLWDQPESWRKCNPSMAAGLLSEEDFETQVQQIKNEPSLLNNFLKSRLSIWTGKNEAWISPIDWEKCKDNYIEQDFYGQSCWCGMDLSKKDDNSAIVYLFEKDNDFYFIQRSFLPRKIASQKQRKDGFQYLDEADKGNIILTDGDVIDYERIRQQLNDDAKLFDILKIGYDTWGAEQLVNQELRLQDGFLCEPIHPTYQGIARATSYLEQCILNQRMHHNNDKMTNWEIANVVCKKDYQENIIPNKRDSTARIDIISALIYALSRWMLDHHIAETTIQNL